MATIQNVQLVLTPIFSGSPPTDSSYVSYGPVINFDNPGAPKEVSQVKAEVSFRVELDATDVGPIYVSVTLLPHDPPPSAPTPLHIFLFAASGSQVPLATVSASTDFNLSAEMPRETLDEDPGRVSASRTRVIFIPRIPARAVPGRDDGPGRPGLPPGQGGPIGALGVLDIPRGTVVHVTQERDDEDEILAEIGLYGCDGTILQRSQHAVVPGNRAPVLAVTRG